MSNQPAPPARKGWLIAVAIILLLIVLILIIPGVRASMSAWMGLSVAPSEQVPASTAVLVALTPQTIIEATEIPVSTQVQSAVTTAKSTEAKPDIFPT